MKIFTATAFVAAALLALAAQPAAAQFSDSYNFLKAVKDRDGAKTTELVNKPGTVIIDTKDITTGEGALHLVTRDRDAVWLNFLLARGAKPDLKDKQGNTPLMIAAQIGFAPGAELLLGKKALVDLANNSGETPLIRAVQNRDMAMVRLLLAAGANANKADTIAGLSARDYARQDRRGATILKLIDDAKPKPAAAASAGPK